MPTLDKLARERTDLHAVAHGGALFADPVHAADGAQPHFERHGRDHGGRQRISGLARAASRRNAATIAQIFRTTATAHSGSARTTTCRSRMSPRAATARPGRSVRDSSASTGSSAARPTNGIRTWSRTTTSSSRRASPEQGYHLSKDLADQAIKMIRNQQAATPSKPWFMWLQPGGQPRPTPRSEGVHRQVQGQVRRRLRSLPHWVLARMIEKGIVPKDTKLTPINPLPGVAGESG